MADVLLALRSLLRQLRRTAIALSAIGFGVIALLLAGGFMEWIFWAMREAAIQSQLGHIQIVRTDYLERGAADPYRFFLPERGAEQRYLEGVDHVREVVPQVNFSGFISHGDATVSFIAQGGDPAKEAVFSRGLTITGGEALSPGLQGGILLGEGLAANLDASPGDTVVLLTTTASGGNNTNKNKNQGIFFTANKEFDDAALRLHLGLAQSLLQEQVEHRLLLMLVETDLTVAVASRIQAHFTTKNAQQKTKPWYRLADFYNKTVALFSRQLGVVAII